VLNILGSSSWKWKVDFILSLFNEFSPQCGLFTDRRQKYFTVVYCNIYLLMICRCRVSNAVFMQKFTIRKVLAGSNSAACWPLVVSFFTEFTEANTDGISKHRLSPCTSIYITNITFYLMFRVPSVIYFLL